MSNLPQPPALNNVDNDEPRPIYKPARHNDGTVYWLAPHGGLLMTPEAVLRVERHVRSWWPGPAAAYQYFMEAAQ